MSSAGPFPATILARRSADGHALITVAVPASVTGARPGQYASVRVGGPDSARLLRRGLWIGEAGVGGRTGATLELVVDTAEPGGAWLAAQPESTQLDVMGPLGRPFPLPRGAVSCLLVGFGVGSAPLIRLAQDLTDRGSRVRFLLLGVGKPFGLVAARRHSAEVIDRTGEQRDWASEVVRELRHDTDLVYSAGTPEQVGELAPAVAAAGVVHQAALHVPLVCGAGTCTACAVPVCGRDGVTRMVRACSEGPAFDADLVRWADLGTVPPDCLGALPGAS